MNFFKLSFSQININKVRLILFFLIAGFPLFPKAVESILMFLFFLTSILIILKTKQKIDQKNIKQVLLLSSVFIVYLFSSVYSNNHQETIKFLIITLPIFLFALSFCFLSNETISIKHFEIIKKIFITSTIISLIICHIYLTINSSSSITNWEYRNMFEDFTKVHGTYFSIWIGFALLMLVHQIKQFNGLLDYKNFLIIILIIIYLIYWQYIIAARLPFFLTIVLILFYVINNLKSSIKYITLFSVTLIAVSLFVVNFNIIKSKIKFGIPEGRYDLKHKEMTSEEIRTGIYYCSFKIFSDDMIFGVGIGDVNDQLNDCYKNNIPSNVYQLFLYNTHNQYMQMALAGGFLGLLFFLYNTFFIFKTSLNRKNSLYLMFNILLAVCFLTENILSRHDGVIFYSYFNIIFYKLRKN